MRAKFSKGRPAIQKIVSTAVALIAIGGCANAKRFLPPGFVKYEDLAKDQPVSTEIQEAVETYATAEDARYPRLREQPSATPNKPSQKNLAAETERLLRAREELSAQIDNDRKLADAEREE